MTNARFCIIPARALGDRRLNRTDILVLNALGMFGDKEGWSFPSTSTIGELLQGTHRTSVSKALSKLAACGYVETRPRYREDGGQTSNEYRILFDAPSVQGQLDLNMPSAPEYDESHPPVADTPPPCSESTTPPVASGATPPVAQPPHRNDPTLTPQGKDSVSNETGGTPPEVDFKKIIFDGGVKLLGGNPQSARSLIARWIRDWGEPAVAAACVEAQRKQAVEPKSYIEGILKKGAKHGKQPARFTDQDYTAGTSGFASP